MKRIRTIMLLSILISGCASDPWTKTDTIFELVYVASIAADAYTTTEIQHHPDIKERQPVTRFILGDNPSTSETWQYFAVLGLSHYLIARSLPASWRRWWQVGGTSYHGYMVYRNCDTGLCGDPESPDQPFCPDCQPIK